MQASLRMPPSLSRHLGLFAIFILAATSLFLYIPAPTDFAVDSDWGVQLAGATQILRGQHPYVDFPAGYGPLTYYLSSIFQLFVGYRPIGEIILVVLGFSVGYAMLFWIIRSATGSNLLAVLFTVLLIIIAPRLYKYFIVLPPAFVLMTIWQYLDRPSPGRFWLVALAVTLAGLFRSDLGLYTGLAAAVMVFVEPDIALRTRLRRGLYLAGMIVIIASLWLLWLIFHNSLGNYLFGSTVGIMQAGVAMSVPLPNFDPSNLLSSSNLTLALYACFFPIPPISLLVFFIKRKQLVSHDQAKILVAITIALTMLTQATHRTDYAHLIQAIPLSVILLAWLTGQAISSLHLPKSIAARSISILGLAAATIIVLLLLRRSLPAWRNALQVSPIEKLQTYSLARDEFIEAVAEKQPDSDDLQAMRFIQDCTPANSPIIAWPYLMSYYYELDRPLGNPQMDLIPGYYTTVQDQDRTVKELSTAKVPIFVYRPFNYGAGAESMHDFVPIIDTYLQENYVPIQQFGDTTIYRFRNNQDDFTCAKK